MFVLMAWFSYLITSIFLCFYLITSMFRNPNACGQILWTVPGLDVILLRYSVSHFLAVIVVEVSYFFLSAGVTGSWVTRLRTPFSLQS